MRRREFIAGLGGAAASWPLAVRAEQASTPVVGFLGLFSSSRNENVVVAIRQGLAEAGFVEGRTVAIQERWAYGNGRRLAPLAAELVQRKVAVIVAIDGGPAILAAKAATSTIPIVFSLPSDPIEFGLVASLSRPGGNMTGVTGFSTELMRKRLDLVCQMAPSARTVAYITDPGVRDFEPPTREILAAARALGLQAVILEARNAVDIDAAFATLVERRAGALVVPPYILFSRNAEKIVALAARHKVPAMYSRRIDVVLGGLMSYSGVAAARLIGFHYVAQILRGAKPADLPVQGPTKFQMVINLKTAQTLGIMVPRTLLAAADEVIEYERGWNLVPTITVVSAAGDPRLPLVGDAVEFWNDTLAELGTQFRLGALTQVAGSVPVEDVKKLATGEPEIPESLKRIPGNIIVVLSEGEFISFTARRASLNKAVVAIKDYRSFPLTLPNVARNVIAHLLGLAIGLAHNADPTTLMCGRPAPCRPDVFASNSPKYFGLTESDKADLRRMYPQSWQVSAAKID
jgi:putative ABC transport system substrate-binding protein